MGNLVGRWELESRLSCGGMGELWLAREWALPNRRAVVKRILPEIAAQTRSVDMFRAEAWLSARLQHAAIVQVLESGEDEWGAPYIVLEHVEGTDLQVLMATQQTFDRKLDPVVAAHVAREVLVALDYVHALTDERGVQLGIVHRDISPANILLSTAGAVKLCDFGVAKVMANQTSGRFLKGKVRYMSPEQVTAGTVDARSDQFSVGAVLWEMLAGAPRFQGTTMRDTLDAVAAGGLPQGARIDAPDAPELLSILARALHPDPAARFPDAGTLARALDGWLARRSVVDPRALLRASVAWAADPGLTRPDPMPDVDRTAPDRQLRWRAP